MLHKKMKKKKRVVQRRKMAFASRVATQIWDEQPCPRNPYLAERCRCRGYDLLELMAKRSFVDVLFLLFLGELPTQAQAGMLESLMIAFINPGPRHPAARAAIYAGCGRTNTANILPVGLSVLTGEHLGGAEATAAMRFLKKHQENDPGEIAESLLRHFVPPQDGDRRIAPGFGSRFNGIEPMSRHIAEKLRQLPQCGAALRWGDAFADRLTPHTMGWLGPGICAAVFLDLGFEPRAGAGLFQLVCAPGLLAHGLELADKPVNSIPFLDEEHYIIEPSDVDNPDDQ
jgi:citrate synthase